MPLRLPDFTDKRCLLLALCGNLLAEEDNPPRGLPKGMKWMTGSYKRSGRTFFLRVGTAFGKGKNHLHIDLATKELFPKNKSPKSTHGVTEIEQTLNRFIGQRVDVDIEGVFTIPQGELPALIKSTLVETSSGDVQIRMTGGTLSVQGAPIHTITWQILREKGDAMVTLAARTKKDVEESYLEDGLTLVESAFNAFVLGSRTNG